MSLIKMTENVPISYNLSRDFQLMENLQTALFNSAKFDADGIENITSTKEVKEELLTLLQYKLGFYSNKQFNSMEIREILSAFPYLVQGKGNREAIESAVILFSNLKQLPIVPTVSFVKKKKNDSTTIDWGQSYCVVISFEGLDYVDTTILEEIFRFILPTGWIWRFQYIKRFPDAENDFNAEYRKGIDSMITRMFSEDKNFLNQDARILTSIDGAPSNDAERRLRTTNNTAFIQSSVDYKLTEDEDDTQTTRTLYENVYISKENWIIKQWSFGVNSVATLYDDNSFVISGTGAGFDFEQSNAPWKDYRNQITSINVGEDITEIGSYSFSGFDNLKRVDFNGEPSRIDENAFYSGNGYSDVSIYTCWYEDDVPNKPWGAKNANIYFIGSPVEIKSWKFGENSTATLYEKYRVENEDYMQVYGTGTGYDFDDAESLTSNKEVAPWLSSEYIDRITRLVIREGIKSVGAYAFKNCSNMSEVSFPDTLTQINTGAFWKCGMLSEITLPESITTVATSSFRECGNTAFDNDGTETEITMPKVNYIQGNAFRGCVGLKEINIPNVKRIGSENSDVGTFRGCINLETVTFADDVEYIGKSTFMGCNKLNVPSLPDTITKIYAHSFDGCSSLPINQLPSGITEIQAGAFKGCTSLALTELPEGITTIDSNSFENCTSITLTELPSSVTDVGNSAFVGCTGLTELTFSGTPTSIGENVFLRCSSLTDIYPQWAQGDTPVDDNSPWGADTSITTIHYSGARTVLQTWNYGDTSTVTLYSDYTMEISGTGGRISDGDNWGSPWCETNSTFPIQSAVFEEGITMISKQCFRGGNHFEQVELSNTIQIIEDQPFRECWNLTSIKLPNSIVTIDANAFDNCGITDIYVPWDSNDERNSDAPWGATNATIHYQTNE